MAHARLAPSSAKRWINCPASVALIEKLPPQKSGYAAAEGTVAHTLHEEYHTGKIDGLVLAARIGTTVIEEGHEVEITEEMYESALEYHDAITADIEALKNPSDKGPQVVHKTEAEVAATSIDPECKGTADKIVYRRGKKLIVRDLKFGRGVVEVEENEQMSVYAIATMDTEAGWAFEEVELVVDQPRAKHEDGKERRWSTTPDALKEFAIRAKAAAAETRNPQAELKAGPWCQSTFCPVRAKCPAVHGQAMASAKVAFSDPVPALLPEAMKSIEKRAAGFSALRLPEVKLMTDAQLVDALRWKEAVGGFFTAVEEHLQARYVAGEKIAGVKLVDGRSNRAWVNQDEVAAKWGEKAWEKKLLSPAKMEALVGKKAGVDEMTYKPEPKKLLVLSSDARPDARVSAQEAFADALPSLDLALPQSAGAAIVKAVSRPESLLMAEAAVEVSCPECDILGVCSRHDVKEATPAAATKPREPIWPV